MSRIFPRAAALALSLLAVPVVAFGAVEYLTPDTRATLVTMSLNAAGFAVPVSPTAPLPTTTPGGTYANASTALPATPTQIFAAAGATPRSRVKLINSSGIGTAGGAAIVEWCRWGTVGAAPAAAGGVGSFALQPGGGIDDQGPGINQSAVNCIAESGTPLLYAEQY
jgi:hypothetical protein